MSKHTLKSAKRLCEGPLYKTEGSGRLTCRNCNKTFKRSRSRLSPCCPDCTQSLAEDLATEIIDDAELAELMKAEEQRPAIDPYVPSPSPAQSGKRYIPLIPVVGVRDGWQVARGLGHKGAIIELMFEDPQSAQAHADRYMRGQGPGRVIEVDLVDAIHLLATPEERYERVERLMFKFTEEEQMLRPVLQGDSEGEKRTFETTDGHTTDALVLARMALARPAMVPVARGASPYRCRRCDQDVAIAMSSLCFKCLRVALHDIATFVVEHTPEITAV